MNIQYYIDFYFDCAFGEVIVVCDDDGDAGYLWHVPTEIPVAYLDRYLVRTCRGTCSRIGNDGTIVLEVSLHSYRD